MNCPKSIRQCPHDWTNCNLCANKQRCDDGTYVPEAELEEPELTVDLSIPIVVDPPVQGIQPSVRGTWAERFSQMTEEERWAEHRKYKPPSLHDKQPIPLDGPSAPGGGSKNKVKKSRTGNKVYTDVWEGI